jgi:phosphate transport system permease protein
MLVVAAAVVSAIVFVVSRGWRPLLHLNFWTRDMSGVVGNRTAQTGH